MMTEPKCINCKYGGQKRFRSAAYMVLDVLKKINYEEGDYGCRASFFEGKETICLNNNFSEYEEA